MKPGIFTAFCPERIEYVVMPTDSPQMLQAYADKGITLVRIHRKVDGRQLEMGPQGNPISGEATRFLALLTKYRG
ncbi:MAG: hypothetical protein H7240_06055, partial [Glaciimonas sp.]|nr:hypothetical protein [Glaciimonas sp.]